jgi:hypothetical protein
MRPSVALSSPAMMRSSVVLPEPLGPSRITISPLAMSRSTASSAVASPNRLLTPSIRISGSAANPDAPSGSVPTTAAGPAGAASGRGAG